MPSAYFPIVLSGPKQGSLSDGQVPGLGALPAAKKQFHLIQRTKEKSLQNMQMSSLDADKRILGGNGCLQYLCFGL